MILAQILPWQAQAEMRVIYGITWIAIRTVAGLAVAILLIVLLAWLWGPPRD